MGLETRLKKLESITSKPGDIICFVKETCGKYECTFNGQTKLLTEKQFNDFVESKVNTNSVFFIGEERLED